MLNTSKQVLLFEALKANRCEYVSSLMDQGVAIESSDLEELIIFYTLLFTFDDKYLFFISLVAIKRRKNTCQTFFREEIRKENTERKNEK